jgi:hypothetical protein
VSSPGILNITDVIMRRIFISSPTQNVERKKGHDIVGGITTPTSTEGFGRLEEG